MFNLLPEKLSNEIKKEYNIRRLIVIFISIVFLSLVFTISLFPSWVILFYKEREVVGEIERSNQSTVAIDAKDIDAKVKSINSELKTIDSFAEGKKTTVFIDRILSSKSKLISINEITYNSAGKSAPTIFLEGVSSTRTALLSFVQSLEETKAFKIVNLPISNFAKDKNINFSINLTVEP